MLNIINLNLPSSLLSSFHTLHKIYCFYSLYKLWESAISHLLALHRLRHGTSPINYIKIQFHGLAPEKASKAAGEATYLSLIAPQKKFDPREQLVYVMKDRSAMPCECKKKKICTKYIFFSLTKRIDPREYAYQSGAAMLASNKFSSPVNRIFTLIGGIAGILTPTLQFHFDSKDLNIFEPDPWIGCIALRTNYSISANRLGLAGALRVGLNGRTWKRMQEDPNKALFGMIQLIAAIGITLSLFKNTHIGSPQLIFAKNLAKLAIIHTIFLSAI